MAFVVGSMVVYRSIPTSNRNSVKRPQLLTLVVYRSIPTSNRNAMRYLVISVGVVYRSIPTSNRNAHIFQSLAPNVVYRSIPTSNRNASLLINSVVMLYIVLFLHQTATYKIFYCGEYGCISFYSYIKPQLVL